MCNWKTSSPTDEECQQVIDSRMTFSVETEINARLLHHTTSPKIQLISAVAKYDLGIFMLLDTYKPRDHWVLPELLMERDEAGQSTLAPGTRMGCVGFSGRINEQDRVRILQNAASQLVDKLPLTYSSVKAMDLDQVVKAEARSFSPGTLDVAEADPTQIRFADDEKRGAKAHGGVEAKKRICLLCAVQEERLRPGDMVIHNRVRQYVCRTCTRFCGVYRTHLPVPDCHPKPMESGPWSQATRQIVSDYNVWVNQRRAASALVPRLPMPRFYMREYRQQQEIQRVQDIPREMKAAIEKARAIIKEAKDAIKIANGVIRGVEAAIKGEKARVKRAKAAVKKAETDIKDAKLRIKEAKATARKARARAAGSSARA
ncbi:MAG: hypothetical protein Q9207_008419 [Kuettlingeria erythrocarpa]